MSEEKCPKCGMPLSKCICDKGEVISVVHELKGLGAKPEGKKGSVSLEEYEKLKKEKENLQDIITISAEVEFDKQKKEFLDLIEDEDKRKEASEMIGESPEALESAKTMTNLLIDAYNVGGVKVEGAEKVRKSTPSGVPSYRENVIGTPDAEAKKIISDLYAVVRNPQASAQEKEIANRKLDIMFGVMIRGFRAGGGVPRISVSSCPVCGSILEADADHCDSCGWERFKKIKTGRKR